jgi:hypothetical protein
MWQSAKETLKNELLFILKTLFPKMSNKPLKAKIFVYICAIIHIIGTIFIIIGIYFPPKYLKLYILYIILILISYYIFDGYCFLTILPNKYSGIKEIPLTITMDTARIIIVILLCIAVGELVFPKYCLYNILFNLLIKFKEFKGYKNML